MNLLEAQRYLRVIPHTTMTYVDPSQVWASFDIGYVQSNLGVNALLLNPTMTVYREGTAVPIQGLSIMPKEIGLYTVRFLTKGLIPGAYTYTLSGSLFEQGIEFSGTFQVGAVSLAQYYIYVLRSMLYDKDSTIYHVNLWFEKYKWDDDVLLNSLRMALNRINTKNAPENRRLGYYTRGYTLDLNDFPVPPDFGDVMTIGAMYYALLARHTYEIPEAFQAHAATEVTYDRKEYINLAQEWGKLFETRLSEICKWDDDIPNSQTVLLGKGRPVYYWIVDMVTLSMGMMGTISYIA